MCRVEERIYINADGHRSKFEEAFPCDKAHKGRLCSKVKKRTTEYYPKKGTFRDDTPSPISPPTPTGSGSYIVQQVRPSSSSGRPSTREGPKPIKPEIVIEFGGKRGKKYPIVPVTNKPRSSHASTGSNDAALESPGSDVSHTIRTGFPEAPLSPQAPVYGHSESYNPPPPASHGYHHRHTSSTASSRTPSLCVTSDPDCDSPTTQRASKFSSPVVHNPNTFSAPLSPSKPRSQSKSSSSKYSTTVVTPAGYSQDAYNPDGLYPIDYAEFADRSASSHASSATSSSSRRVRDPGHSRKKDEERRRQEELDRDVTEEAKEENIKQVRFELGRAKGRAEERAENLQAEKEKQRAADREEMHRRKEKEREAKAVKEKEREVKVPKEKTREVKVTKEKDRESKVGKEKDRESKVGKEHKKEKSKPPTTDYSVKRPGGSRRLSLTHTQMEEQKRLLAADVAHMQNETQAAEAREREERTALMRQQQQDLSYYNPRAGGMPVNNVQSSAPPIGRRASVSRRDSISKTDARPILTRPDSHRSTHASQPNPPPINTQLTPANYPRHPSARTHAPPPVSFPSNFNTRPPPSARRPSLSAPDNPFAAPPSRSSGSSIENPFAVGSQVLSPPAAIHQDPWDARVPQDVLPSTRSDPDGRYTMERRGYDVINGATSHNYGHNSHAAAQQATYAIRGITGYDDDYAISSEDERTYGNVRRR